MAIKLTEMKKLRIIDILGLCIITTVLTISTKSIKADDRESISNRYKDIRHYGTKEFINMDLGIIGYFPTKNHWSKISKSIRIVPIDSLRYIDSLDINKLADTLYVKIYSQNYICHSRNTYKITRNTNKSIDTLMIYNIDVDLKMKAIIADAETFRVNNFTIGYSKHWPD